MDIMKTFKLGKHYAIERFGIAVAGLAIALVVFIAGGTTYTVQRNAAQNAATAIYTPSFATSGSNTSGSVLGIYTNESHTRAAVLMQISDMSKLSIDASDYKIDLYGVDDFGYVDRVESNPACGMYVYGDSGYMVFYMTASEALPRQRLGMLCNMGFTLGGSGIESTTTTETFTISFNPGADNVYTVDALEGETFDPVSFYQEVVTSAAESDMRSQLADDLGTMRNELSYILEYTSRVQNDGIITDGMMPEWVVGDSISVNDDNNLVYTCATPVPGGLDFDWMDCSIADGESYIDAALAASDYESVNELLDALSSVQAPSIGDNEWILSDGTPLSAALTGNPNDERYVHMNDDTTTLEAAWAAYGATKAHYQGDHIYALINLENEGDKVASTYTSTTTNDGNITINR